MIILRMTLPIKFTLIMQRDCRGILKKLDTERNTLNFNHSDSQHIEYKHFFSNYLLTNRSFVFSWNYLEKFSERICIGLRKNFGKSSKSAIQTIELFQLFYVIITNKMLEIFWVETIRLHVSCKYVHYNKHIFILTWDTKYLDICWYINVDVNLRILNLIW